MLLLLAFLPLSNTMRAQGKKNQAAETKVLCITTRKDSFHMKNYSWYYEICRLPPILCAMLLIRYPKQQYS